MPVVLDEEQHSHLERIGLKLPKVRGLWCCRSDWRCLLWAFLSMSAALALPVAV